MCAILLQAVVYHVVTVIDHVDKYFWDLNDCVCHAIETLGSIEGVFLMYLDGLVQDCCISSAYALEIQQSWAKLSVIPLRFITVVIWILFLFFNVNFSFGYIFKRYNRQIKVDAHCHCFEYMN